MDNPTDAKETVKCAPPAVSVVDADEAEREHLCRLLGRFGLEAPAYPNAEAFLARRRPQRLGCLVTEADLPGLGGLELLSLLRREGVDVPVIVMARKGDVETAVRAMRAGAVDVFEKPIVERVLLECILQILAWSAEPGSNGPAAGKQRRRVP
jgi:FixJ family two-component response regulator